jgi:hypothetical protein
MLGFNRRIESRPLMVSFLPFSSPCALSRARPFFSVQAQHSRRAANLATVRRQNILGRQVFRICVFADAEPLMIDDTTIESNSAK